MYIFYAVTCKGNSYTCKFVFSFQWCPALNSTSVFDFQSDSRTLLLVAFHGSCNVLQFRCSNCASHFDCFYSVSRFYCCNSLLLRRGESPPKPSKVTCYIDKSHMLNCSFQGLHRGFHCHSSAPLRTTPHY